MNKADEMEETRFNRWNRYINLTLEHDIFIKIDTQEQLNLMENIAKEYFMDEKCLHTAMGIGFNDYKPNGIYQLPIIIYFNEATNYLITSEGLIDGKWPLKLYEDIYKKAITPRVFENLEYYKELFI